MPASTFSRFLLAASFAIATLAAQPCESCHAEIVQRYRKTAMAQSIGKVAPLAGSSFAHEASGSTMRASIDKGAMTHTVARDGLEAVYPIALAIGSGRVGQSYAVRIGEALFQSPLSWYAQASKWAVSPGFEHERHPDFDRPITSECLFCHSSTKNAQPQSIGCERCHGDGAKHAAAPSKANIVQPSRLNANARDAICEQCHLQGAARITAPGKTVHDFTPGMRLEQIISIYVRASEDFRVVSHSEQLRASSCAQASSGRLWCGTCHDPHPAQAPTRADYNRRCESCHMGIEAKHAAPAEDCAGCHMPARPVSDVAHTAYTDHRISKRPSQQPPDPVLKPWRPSGGDERGLALAYAATGGLRAAKLRLDPLLSRAAKPDIELLVTAGSIALGLKQSTEAFRHFDNVIELDPVSAEHYFRKGLALEALGNTSEAVVSYRQALRLAPALFDAAARLAALQRRQGDLGGYRASLERFLEIMPQNLTIRRLLRDVAPAAK